MRSDSLPRGAALYTAACLALGATALAQSTSRVSVDTSGLETNDGSSRPSLSYDGNVVCFYSDASNLVPGDTNAVTDVFCHDRSTGTTTRVSESALGIEGNGKSTRAAVSGDGRYVGFYSDADNLVPGDTNLARDVFVRDLQEGGLVRVSVSSLGVQGNLDSSRPNLSATGRFVAFFSDSTNLVPGDTNLARDAFLHDRDADEDGIFDEPGAISTIRVSVRSNGNEGNGDSSIPRVSGNGRHVAFRSIATNLVAGDTNAAEDVFSHDARTGVTVRISVRTGGAEANSDSSRPSISNDGRFIAYYSSATNLVSGDTNLHCFLDPLGQTVCVNAIDCFVRDRDTDEDGLLDEVGAVKTVRVSVKNNGNEANDRSEDPEISADGRFVTFWSDATNLVANDSNGVLDIFLHDRDADGDGVFDEAGAIMTTRVNVSTAGAQANNTSKRPFVSGDGRFVAFRSEAGNLVAGDTNGLADVFVRDTCVGACDLGANYCGPAELNSAGLSAIIRATGSTSVLVNGFELVVSDLPPNKFGYFLVSAAQGLILHPGGSQGNLCLGGAVGRFNGQIRNSGSGGTFGIDVDLGVLPVNPPRAVAAGETWNFACWYRDNIPATTSNFSDATEVVFKL